MVYTFLKIALISKYFSSSAANDNVGLEVKKGEIHSLLRENGAGKTILINVLYNLYKPHKGKIFIVKDISSNALL